MREINLGAHRHRHRHQRAPAATPSSCRGTWPRSPGIAAGHGRRTWSRRRRTPARSSSCRACSSGSRSSCPRPATTCGCFPPGRTPGSTRSTCRRCRPGSTIMPGKVNPVIPEVVNQVAFEVIGNDITVTMAAEAGQLQLNAFEPIIARAVAEPAAPPAGATDADRALRPRHHRQRRPPARGRRALHRPGHRAVAGDSATSSRRRSRPRPCARGARRRAGARTRPARPRRARSPPGAREPRRPAARAVPVSEPGRAGRAHRPARPLILTVRPGRMPATSGVSDAFSRVLMLHVRPLDPAGEAVAAREEVEHHDLQILQAERWPAAAVVGELLDPEGGPHRDRVGPLDHERDVGDPAGGQGGVEREDGRAGDRDALVGEGQQELRRGGVLNPGKPGAVTVPTKGFVEAVL